MLIVNFCSRWWKVSERTMVLSLPLNGKGRRGRKEHQQAIAWSIYSGCKISTNASSKRDACFVLPKAMLAQRRGKKPWQMTYLTWGRTPWVCDELLVHPASLVGDHQPSFPTPLLMHWPWWPRDKDFGTCCRSEGCPCTLLLWEAGSSHIWGAQR